MLVSDNDNSLLYKTRRPPFRVEARVWILTSTRLSASHVRSGPTPFSLPAEGIS